jgi:hypothetical protein
MLSLGWIIRAHAIGGVNAGAVNVLWDPSPDTNVVGYYLYYGPASGNYTHRVDVASATGASVTGLTSGTTNYFIATAYDALGRESLPSNEASYIDPGTLAISLDSSNQLHLLFPIAAHHSYDVQFSVFLTNWLTLATIVGETNSIFDFIDTNDIGAAQKFYRLILH